MDVKIKKYIPSSQTKGTKLKINKTRHSHEIRRHKWQDKMNLYKNRCSGRV